MACGYPRLIPLNWLIWRSRRRTETVEAIIGEVEIRGVPAGRVAETRVKGDPARALHVGARRLVRYAGGENVAAAVPGTVLPVVQQRTASGRWLISMSLRAVDGAVPAPLSPKINVVAREAAWIAVVLVSGCSIDVAPGRGRATILEATAGTGWLANGPPMVRLRRRWRWPWSRWEIAVPLSRNGSLKTD
jgi:hypothetical protein